MRENNVTFMELSKQVVSLDPAKRLKELGVQQESLFYWCGFYNDSGGKTWFVVRHDVLEDYEEEPENYAAFTVAELGTLLPLTVQEEKKTYRLHLSKEEGDFSDEIRWFIEYRNRDAIGYTLLVQRCAETEADARARALIYLVENKLVTL
jgi:hypothetical protein